MLCDFCGNEIHSVAMKVYRTDSYARVRGRIDANNYTFHSSIGFCCVTKVADMMKWHKRQGKQREVA